MKRQPRLIRKVAIGVLTAPIALVAVVVAMAVYAALAVADLIWPENPETMTDEEKHRFYGYRKDW